MFFPEKPVPVEVVRELATLLRDNNLGELAIESGDEENALRLQLQRETIVYASAAPVGVEYEVAPFASAQVAEEIVTSEQTALVEESREIGAPCVGVYRAPKKPLQVGDKVRVGQIIAIVESLRVPNEVLSPVDATIIELPVEVGQGVEWGQTLVVLGANA